MARISNFQNMQLDYAVADGMSKQNGRIMMHHIYLPGTLSFNTVALLHNPAFSTQNSTGSITFSFGLYSLNVSTLSLANSASGSTSYTKSNTKGVYFVTLATSATQDISPGEWYFAFMSSTSGGPATSAGNGMICNNPNNITGGSAAYGGPFVRGMFTATTTAFPASIATSNMSKEATSTSIPTTHPYILITS